MTSIPFLCSFLDEINKKQEYDEPFDLEDFINNKLKIKLTYDQGVVLILTRYLDVEASIVGIELLKKGIPYIRMNIEDFPLNIKVTYRIDEHNIKRIKISIKDKELDPSIVKVVWLRHFYLNLASFGIDRLSYQFSLEQWDSAFKIFLSEINGKWINEINNTNNAYDRLNHSHIARNLGFNIPNTLFTNDSQDAIKFYHDNDKDIIIKALHNHFVEFPNGDIYSMFSHTVREEDLKRINQLEYAPCIFQRRIKKKHEIRTTVVGEEIFVTKLESQITKNAEDDIHRCVLKNLPKISIEMDKIFTERCKELVKSMGLSYAALDFIVDYNGDLIFLEVNPIGDWYWIERQSKQPISKSMGNLIEHLYYKK